MSAEYDGVRAKAIALIKRKGRPIQILVGGDNTPADANKPWNVTKATPTATACSAVVVDLSTTASAEHGIMDKTCIVPGDCGLFEIDQTMRVKVLAVTGSSVPDRIYAIDAVTVYEPDGIPIGWKLRLTAWPRTLQAQPTKF